MITDGLNRSHSMDTDLPLFQSLPTVPVYSVNPCLLFRPSILAPCTYARTVIVHKERRGKHED